MAQNKIKAFTLVELIVVITILAILGTIAFISLQGYSKSARDSTRLSDIGTIETSLELFTLQSGYYPEPTSGADITYSGGTIWTQGTIGNSVLGLSQRLNKKPVDPLTGSEYTYSRLNTKKEIEIAAVLEDGYISQISSTNAGNKQGTAYVKGNYNGAIAKVSSGVNIYVLAVPSIISGDISLLDYQSLIDNNKLVINSQGLLPYSYEGSVFNTDDILDLGMNDILVYSDGSNLPVDIIDIQNFTSNIIESYSGSVVGSNMVSAIVSMEDDQEIILFGKSMVENILGGVTTVTGNESLDDPSIVESPSFLSKTQTGIVVSIGNFQDPDGVQNIEAELYTDSGITNLLLSSATGDFAGLSLGTTYYIVTKGEAFNSADGIYEIKRSLALEVTTNNIPILTDCTVTTPGTECGGGYIAGNTNINGTVYTMIATPGNCTDSATPTCDNGGDTLTKTWGPTITIGADNDDGAINTSIIAAQGSSYAASYCEALVLNGYSDWYLPALYGLKDMQVNKDVIPGIITTYYWSSQEASSAAAYRVNMFNGSHTGPDKFLSARFRCVRKFQL